MKRSYLIQRLSTPVNDKLFEAFSFGGGLKNGGLSEKAMSLLRSIFSFEYMGSAEFEYGAVPDAILKIAKNVSDYTGWMTSIDKKSVFVISHKDWIGEINILLKDLALSNPKNRLKEYINFDRVLSGKDYWGNPCKLGTCGWLELDNGFFFFTDKEMFQKTCQLFGINTKN